MRQLALAILLASFFGGMVAADETHHHEDLTTGAIGHCAFPNFLRRAGAEWV